MPPASFTPRRSPVVSAKSRTASSITSATGGVAAGVILPVEVLMKSPPASSASQDARRTLSRVASSPVSRITLRWAGPHAALVATISSNTCRYRPARNAPRSITMSISVAPAATASRTSCSLVSSAARPTGTRWRPRRPARRCRAARRPRSRPGRGTRTPPRPAAPTGRDGSGRTAFAHSERTLPGVSDALERGEVDHRDRGVDRPGLGRGLDAAGGQTRPPGPRRRPGRRRAGRAGSGAASRRRAPRPTDRSRGTALVVLERRHPAMVGPPIYRLLRVTTSRRPSSTIRSSRRG